MNTPSQTLKNLTYLLGVGLLLVFATVLNAKRNDILCEIRFYGATDAERSAGVWIDGTYMGYLDELKGNKKILLIPGEHQMIFRQTGYKDLVQKIALGPGQKQELIVTLERDPQAQYSSQVAEVKIAVWPKRAAVFVDNNFVGHASEFNGLGKGMLVSPGKHKFTITLPAWQTFETEVTLAPTQHFVLRTSLLPGDITKDAAPMKE